ncbi:MULTISPECIES: nucleotide sugar dehydrogenase [Gordonia]|uniref:UDP-glucose 6-dehydrogenase n=1 Tax=Gordonia tangerina TaxID=2911060 RepID=A0ABS9DLN7_9ACTN|nr:nucleotide sugar dehydrogenase [Gordonia tangerina]MCF3940160.1 nucleotide sugar dehydrogenase [Gordonia tangerina]
MTKPVLSVFGLGYVGSVSAACFAARGHRVIGVDSNPHKSAFLRSGKTTVVEEGIGELTAEQVGNGRLEVSDDACDAVLGSDMSIVCVGTPSAPNGSLSTTYLERVTEEVAIGLAVKDSWHVVVYRSTMLPGTCEQLLIPILERGSGKRAGIDFGVCVNPEFLREGTSVRDFQDPPKTVVGESDPRSGEAVLALYDGLPGPRFRTPIAIAEMTKYIDNSFHALKVGFANEIGAVCAALGLDSHRVMDIFLADAKLNISRAYLRPGFAFGGSCLPKDVRALTHTARAHDVVIPVLASLITSNDVHLCRAVDIVIAQGRRDVGIFGLSFKAGTDDLRESPMVELAERLIGKGFRVRIYDPDVAFSRLIGANRRYIEDQLPHIGELLTDSIDEILEHADTFVVGSRSPEIAAAIDELDGERFVLDLVRLPGAEQLRNRKGYVGIGW